MGLSGEEKETDNPFKDISSEKMQNTRAVFCGEKIHD